MTIFMEGFRWLGFPIRVQKFAWLTRDRLGFAMAAEYVGQETVQLLHELTAELFGGLEPGRVALRKPAGNRGGELGGEIAQVFRSEDVIGSEQFRRASRVFRTEDGNSAEDGLIGDKAPNIFEGGQDEKVGAAIDRRHFLG